MILLIDKKTNKTTYQKKFLIESETPATYFNLQAPKVGEDYILKVKFWNKK